MVSVGQKLISETRVGEMYMGPCDPLGCTGEAENASSAFSVPTQIGAYPFQQRSLDLLSGY